VAYSVILHLPNEDPLLAELDELPKAGDTNVSVTNIRKRDGGRVAYLDGDAERVFFPWHRITFIEIMPSEAEKAKLVKFYRE
jgi:predicted alpha/beta-fold hydrolase